MSRSLFFGLPWVKQYLVPGCPENVIRVQFRRPAFITEDVLVRIDSVEGRTFHCTVVCQPKKDWRINKGDTVLVEYYYFENAYRLVCRTIEKKFGFEWV
jgi:hypothetical protein